MSGLPVECTRIERGSPTYPDALERLGAAAPAALTACGATVLLRLPLLGVFSSVRAPGETALAAYDLARALRDAGVPVIGGFQSPLERDFLELALPGSQPVVVCPARGTDRMRAGPGWQVALAERRLLVLSGFPPHLRRPTATMAERRNRMVAALASGVLILHATPGGRIHRLALEALSWKKPVYCLDLPASRDLVVMGARPLSAGVPFDGSPGSRG